MISAHRCGAGEDIAAENTLAAIKAAVRLDVEYIEFDVQRCADGAFVLFHDDYIDVAGRRHRLTDVPSTFVFDHARQVLPYEMALTTLKAGGKRAHVDLKTMGTQPIGAVAPSVAAAARAVEVLGPENVLITSLEDGDVARVREWSSQLYPELLVGLSLGRDVSRRRPVRLLRTRLSELFPRRRLRRADANLVVAHKDLARIKLASWARRAGLPLLVWTVNDRDELAHWLARDDAFLITTNFPKDAVALRREADGTALVTPVARTSGSVAP